MLMQKNLTKLLRDNFLFQASYFAPFVPAMKILHKNCTILLTVPEERKKGYASEMIRFLIAITKKEKV